MTRHVQSSPEIGQRIRDRRKALGLTVRQAAAAADLSHSTLSRIERGEISADNRFTLADIALALRCSVSDLTGARTVPDEREAAGVGAAVYDVINAITEADPAFPSSLQGDLMPVEALRERVGIARDLRVVCQYLDVARLIPDAVLHLHAHIAGPDREEALRLLVLADEVGANVVRYVGPHPQHMALLAERMRDAARMLGDPVLVAYSLFTVAHSHLVCGRYQLARVVASQALEDVRPHMDAVGGSEVYGQLCLTVAFALRGMGQEDDAKPYVVEAKDVGRRTGDTSTLDLYFGPTNTNVWQLSMATDGGDPELAVAIARDTHIERLGSRSRQVAFYSDTGRALARVGNGDAAIRMLQTAEGMAPARVRADQLVKETVRNLVDQRRRRAVPPALRGLAERVGVGA